MKKTLVAVVLVCLLFQFDNSKAGAFFPENQAKMAMGIHALIYNNFTTQEARWIGTNTDLLMIQSPLTQIYKDRVIRLASEAKNANPNLKIYLYKNWLRSGTLINKESSVNILEDTLVPATDYPKFFKYTDSNNQPISGKYCEYLTVEDTKYCMKFLQSPWQDYFINKSLFEAAQYGRVNVAGAQVPAVDGIFIDELKNRDQNHLGKFSSHPSGGKFLVNAGDDCRMLFSSGCQVPKSGGYCGFCPETSQATGGIMDETFMTNWDYARDKCQNPFMSADVVRTQLWQAQEAVKKNKLHWLVLRVGPYSASAGCLTHRQLLTYTFAGYLLVANGQNVYFYSKTDSSSSNLGHYRNEFTTNPDKDLFSLPLGEADGPYEEWLTGNGYYYRRLFSSGRAIVLVNPNNSAITNISLAQGRVFVDQDAHEYQNSLNIAPHQGIILIDKEYQVTPIPTLNPSPTVSGGPSITIDVSLAPSASPSGAADFSIMGFQLNMVLIAATAMILIVMAMIFL